MRGWRGVRNQLLGGVPSRGEQRLGRLLRSCDPLARRRRVSFLKDDPALVLVRGGGRAVVTAVTAVRRCPVRLGAFARALVCLVMPNDTSRTSAQQTVVTRKVTRYPADRCTL
jgi:hypothetical protein